MQEIFYWQAPLPITVQEPFTVSLAGETFGQHYRMQRDDAWEYVCAYVQSGGGTLVYDGRTYNLRAGDVFVLHKHSDHTYYADIDDPFHFLWFNCLGKLMPHLFQAYGLDRRVVIAQFGDPALFCEFHEICRTNTDPAAVYTRCAVQFHRMVAAFAAHIEKMEKSDSLAYQVKCRLDERLNEPLSLKAVAAGLGYSAAHIGRCFKAAYGVTPYQYLLEQKLTAAEKLLRGTDMRVRQAALLFGFNDEFHFSNAFYRHFGYRPRTLRGAEKEKNV